MVIVEKKVGLNGPIGVSVLRWEILDAPLNNFTKSTGSG